MKLDTSSYYPESLLEEEVDETVEITVDSRNDRKEEKGNDEEGKKEPEVSSLPGAGERFADGVAQFLSWALVPLLMPVYGVLLAFNLSILDFTPFPVKLVFTLVTLAFTVAVPTLLVLLLKRMGLVTDVGLNGRKERVIPYIISILCLAGAGAFMWYKGAPMWLVMFFGGGAVAGAINLLINFRWKISAHAAGVAGVVALLIRIIRDGLPQEGAFIWLLIAIGLSGILGTARVWLGRHTVWQVLAGYAVGFLSVILMTLL
ncbi:MAG: phosphatase PAP2 family protein [Muribaculaceae bacterium]|nr:phosphatase PAP2 family protein [Muribaculaceae bacterium]